MDDLFNLIEKPWITCTDSGGERCQHGLLDLLAGAHELRTLSLDTPIENAALYRLLLAILARVFGPASYDEWHSIYNHGHFDAGMLEAYFSAQRARFNLFDPERPFYQAADERVRPKTPLKLMPHLASGNNPTLFDHSTEAQGITLEPFQAARFVLALQTYGLGGLSGIKEKFTGAPPGRGVSFFTQGQTLFETLVLNMIRYTGHDEAPIPSEAQNDLPAWEMNDPFEPRDTPHGLLDYLTWQNRRVLLLPEQEDGRTVVRQITEAPGLRMADDFINGVSIRDPYQYYRKGSSGPTVLRFREDRAVWRDSAALLRFTDKDGGMTSPPNLEWLSELCRAGMLKKRQTYQLAALGMAADRAKVMFYREEHLPLPLAYLQEIEYVERLQAALNAAQAVRNSLIKAIRMLSELLLSFRVDQGGRKPDPADVDRLQQHLGADRLYWSSLEQAFHPLITGIPANTASAEEEWRQHMRASAWEALEYAIRLTGESGRALKAAVRARASLGSGLNKILDSQSKEVNDGI